MAAADNVHIRRAAARDMARDLRTVFARTFAANDKRRRENEEVFTEEFLFDDEGELFIKRVRNSGPRPGGGQH